MQYHPKSQQQDYQKQREVLFQQHDQEKQQKRRKIMLIVSSLVIILLLSSGIWAYQYYFMPGPYDTFAQCLTEKGAVMYGAIEWCKYTQGQAHMFGKSFEYINYQDESKLPGLKTRPTWVIDGRWYEKVQSFETLSALTGCPLE